jgi:hypothetical protein
VEDCYVSPAESVSLALSTMSCCCLSSAQAMARGRLTLVQSPRAHGTAGPARCDSRVPHDSPSRGGLRRRRPPPPQARRQQRSTSNGFRHLAANAAIRSPRKGMRKGPCAGRGTKTTRSCARCAATAQVNCARRPKPKACSLDRAETACLQSRPALARCRYSSAVKAFLMGGIAHPNRP